VVPLKKSDDEKRAKKTEIRKAKNRRKSRDPGYSPE